MTQPYTVYFAGELFSSKHVIGNAILAELIQKESTDAYRCILPQELEPRESTAVGIRNIDLFNVVSSDLGLFQFDGPELDSGTVVEFMVAKMLDIPSVIVRTDFRAAGDSQEDPWNLMCSGYPRTKVVLINALATYQQILHSGSRTSSDASIDLARAVASQIVTALDDVKAIKPVLSADARDHIYEWIRHMPGQSFAELLSRESLKSLLSSKVERGLL